MVVDLPAMRADADSSCTESCTDSWRHWLGSLCAQAAARTSRSSSWATNSACCAGRSTDPRHAHRRRPELPARDRDLRPRYRDRAEPGGWSPPTLGSVGVGTAAASSSCGPHVDPRGGGSTGVGGFRLAATAVQIVEHRIDGCPETRESRHSRASEVRPDCSASESRNTREARRTSWIPFQCLAKFAGAGSAVAVDLPRCGPMRFVVYRIPIPASQARNTVRSAARRTLRSSATNSRAAPRSTRAEILNAAGACSGRSTAATATEPSRVAGQNAVGLAPPPHQSPGRSSSVPGRRRLRLHHHRNRHAAQVLPAVVHRHRDPNRVLRRDHGPPCDASSSTAPSSGTAANSTSLSSTTSIITTRTGPTVRSTSGHPSPPTHQTSQTGTTKS